MLGKHLMMCPPDFYNVEYEINPWMHKAAGTDLQVAQMQWRQLHRVLTDDCHCRVETIQPVDGLPDMVFTANAGLVFGKRVIPSNFRHPERQGETSHFSRWFQEQGYQVEMLPEELDFEGEGDALFLDGLLFAGYRTRTEIRTHHLISEMLGIKVVSLPLVDSRFYHLDTCFCPLDAETAAYYPPAFDEYARKTLAAHIPTLIEIADADAVHFAANTVVMGRDVIMNAHCDGFAEKLRGMDYTVHSVDLSQFLRAGGSAKCLVCTLPG
jgi:N-dimethylarginine dimethylaminohydrolase